MSLDLYPELVACIMEEGMVREEQEECSQPNSKVCEPEAILLKEEPHWLEESPETAADDWIVPNLTSSPFVSCEENVEAKQEMAEVIEEVKVKEEHERWMSYSESSPRYCITPNIITENFEDDSEHDGEISDLEPFSEDETKRASCNRLSTTVANSENGDDTDNQEEGDADTGSLDHKVEEAFHTSGKTSVDCNKNDDESIENPWKMEGYQCEICHKSFKQQRFLRNHISTHSLDKDFTCNICSKKFRKERFLRNHMPIHSLEKKFTCNICSRSYTQKGSFMNHLRSHKQEHIQCKLCSNTYSTRYAFQEHMRTHEGNRHNCTLCPKTFTYKSGLRLHMLVHQEKRFLCTFCSKSFQRKWSLIDHIKVHKGVRFSCTICSKTYSRKSQVNQHITTEHEGKRFTCMLCPKSYFSKTQLNDHMRLHNGERFLCTVCNRTYSHRRNLTEHMQIHTGKLFSCELCVKSFTRRSALSTHMKTHSKIENT